jgi:hypothetical protein
MNRRGERRSLHERIHGAPPLLESSAEPETPPAQQPPIRPCWVTDEHGRLPGLLLEWRLTVSGWHGRVVRAVVEEGCWVVVEEWLPAALLAPGSQSR